MRIITGQYKGRRLRPVDDPTVRSTSDRAKESLFNILAAEVPDREVLDLFCGAGTLGLEALSRGARHATFVDAGRRSVQRTGDNIQMVGAEASSTILQSDVMAALRAFAAKGLRFSLVFADPPYEQGWSRKLPKALADTGVMDEDAIVVLEHHRKEPPEDLPAGFSLWTERRFGDTMLSIWRWSGDSREVDSETVPGPEGGETS